LKSHVNDHYLELAQAIYIDACARCPADVSDLRDLKTIRSRVKQEGLSFLTITLPNFCKAFEFALSEARIDPSWRKTIFRGFPFHGAIPAFLQGMLGLMFDMETGSIYDESNSSVDHSLLVDCIRQICLAFKKLELDCAPERVQSAIDGFIEIEQNFSTFSVPKLDADEFRSVSSVLWDNDVYRLRDSVLVPRHGPGATAERVSGNQKYVWRRWHKRLDNYFPFFEHGLVESARLEGGLKGVSFIPEDEEQPVRVTPVPKTLKGPRIIAIEPACMQYAQQALRDVLYGMIEDSPLTSGHINFRDQEVNQELALSSSATGQFATIDLSEASDRVPRDLALEMFRGYPEFRETVDACRSTHAELPDGQGIIGPLGKFASMGSALCFPVESMYFYTICVMALLRNRNLPVTRENVFIVSREVYVYGDDILVPSDEAGIVLVYLQKYNCKINHNKSFFKGNFRESCGVDAFAGTLVTPVYVRQPRPEDKQQVNSLISWSATANLFFRKGYVRTAELMHTVCERILRVYPEISENDQALGRSYSFGPRRPRRRFNRELHRPEIRAWIPKPVYRTDVLGGYAALQKSLLRLSLRKERTVVRNVHLDMARLDPRFLVDPSDPYHLERSALYGAVTLKLRWVPAS
jgi:hypothetical protein